MTQPAAEAGRARPAVWLAAIALAGLAFNLRPGATSLGPVLSEALADLGQSAAYGGLLTALPGFAFALFGLAAVALARAMGLVNALWLGLAAAASGLVARTLTDDAVVFVVCSVLAFGGMAIGNVLAPPFVRRMFPQRVPHFMTLYSVVLALGATVASFLTVPLATSLAGGWRASLAVWGWTAAAGVLPLVVVALVTRGSGTPNAASGGFGRLLRSRRAIALGFFFGIQSMQAYVQFGWVAQMYRDGGADAATAGLMAGIIAAFGVPTGLVMPMVVHRVRDLRPVVTALCLLLVAGYAGIWVAPTTYPWLWAVLLGLSAAAFPMALALVTARSRDPHITAQLSGLAQSIGYTLAAIGPFVVGALYGATGSWTVPLGLLMASSVVMWVAGLMASAPGFVDDELA